jgi:FkbM family methyltransferase
VASPDNKTAEEMREEIKFKTFAMQSLIGQRERLLALIDLMANVGGLGVAQMRAVPESQSQFRQELFALVMAKGKSNGYFVEFGACDGLYLSNTSVLEKTFDWRGILVEPSRAWHAALETARSATIDLRFVSAKTGKLVTFEEAEDPGESTVVKGPKTTRARYSVETVSLTDLLKEHQAPKNIDYLSIDSAGTEFDILNAFDFSNYNFGFISVQNQDGNPVTSLLESCGYKILYPREPDLESWSQISGFDSWYVPN